MDKRCLYICPVMLDEKYILKSFFAPVRIKDFGRVLISVICAFFSAILKKFFVIPEDVVEVSRSNTPISSL